MNVRSLNKETIMSFGRIDDEATDVSLLESMFLPAAKEYMMQHTGMTQDDMDMHPDVAVAVCALCVQMYDNRSVNVDADKLNQVVVDIINRYSVNLIPKE